MANPKYPIASDGGKDFTGYLATPPSGRGPGLLLLQEVYGVNADIKAIAEAFAAKGYVVLAPDILWRKAPNLDFPYAERDAAGAVLKELGGAEALFEDVAAAVAALRRAPGVEGKVGVIGVGFGSVLAIKAVGNGRTAVDAGVTVHGGRVEDLALEPKIGAWQFHFAENDAVLPAEIEAKTRAAYANHAGAEVHLYPGVRHGYAVAGRPEYDAAAAALTFQRISGFLAKQLHLGVPAELQD